jgi:DNA-binding SARP family transcriptional activator/tetratricopeptide (TPR) repeat protein
VAGLEVLLFGGFQLRRHGEALPPIPSRAARSLFAYLVVNRGTRHPRERLASEFWPELPATRARRRLSHTLWQIQDALGEASTDPDHLEVAADTLAVRSDADFRVDVEEFERGLDRLRSRRSEGRGRSRDLADLEAVVDLYQGDFLAGHYDGWVVDEHQRLEHRYLDALIWLVELARSHGAYEDALTYARRLTNQDPLREDAHREVMRLSTLLGRTSDALRQYERCRAVLADELGTAPSVATEQLHDRILRQRQQGPVALARPDHEPFPDRLPLLGRESERNAAIGVLENALTGVPGAALVEGDPGAGKSRFVAELVDDGEWRGFEILSASCRGPEPTAPYAVVRQLLEPALTPLRLAQLLPRVSPVWLGLVAQIVPAVRAALPPEHRLPPAVRQEEGAQRLRDALGATLSALAELDPLLIAVDDVQWADDASLEVLVAVATATGEHRTALLLSYRGQEARARPPTWDAIRDIDRRSRAVRIGLGPLDAFSIAELIRAIQRGRDLAPATATRLQRETGGNPLFVVETLRAMAESATDADALPLPSSIRELVLDRLEPLSSEARTVLDLAAIGGDGTDLDTLEIASELPPEVVADTVGTLVRRSLLRELDEGFGSHHDQIRRVLLDALEPPVTAALHRRVGEALEQSHPGSIARLAHHFCEAGVPRKAVTYLRAAGREAAAVHAYAAADGYLTRAIEQQRSRPASVAARFALLAEHEAVLDVLGDRDRQRRAVDELVALAAGAPHRESDALRRRALLAAQVGELNEAEEAARRALAIVTDTGDDASLPGALLTLARILAWGGQRRAAIPVFARALDLPDLPPSLELELRTTVASVLRELQRYDEAGAELATALRLATQRGELREEAHALGVLGTVRMETGHATEAGELYGQAIERCRAIGFRRGEGINLVNQGNVLYGCGRVGEALTAYAQAAEIFVHLGDRRGEAAVQLNLGFVSHAVLGDDACALRELDAALAYFASVGDVQFEAACRDARASVALRAGDLATATAELERAMGLPGIADHAWTTCQLLQRRAEVALAADETAAARELIAEARQLADRHDLADLAVGLVALEGTSLLAAGDATAAVASTQAAVDALHEGVERGYLVHLRHHEALTAAGLADRARAAADRAVAGLSAVLDGLADGDRARAEALPEHRRIRELAERTTGLRALVAAASAPRGRPLRPVELVEVVVDVDPGVGTPDDPIERRRHVLRHVADQIRAQGGVATVTDLAGLLEVSEATVRRDLQALRATGTQVETRGRRHG